MITKELFIKTINELERLSKLEEQAMELGICLIEITCAYEEMMLAMLKEIFDDRSDWIGYFIYELEYGAKYHDGCIIDKEKGIIKLATPSDLFDLVWENNFNQIVEDGKARDFAKAESDRLYKSGYEYERGL